MRQRKSKAPAKTRMSADRTLDAAELGPKPRRKPSNDRAARGHIVGAVGSVRGIRLLVEETVVLDP